MSPTTAPPPATATATALLLNDDDYNSASDDDFDPTVAPSDTTPKKRKRRSSSSSAASYASDEGGEGGLIKTRAQKARESHTRPVVGPAPSTGSTADVDELWRQMNTKPSTKPATPAPEEEGGGDEKAKVNVEGEETITISRTYTFAGTTHTELKTVPRSSQEARTYLSSISPNPASTTAAAVGTVDPAVPLLPRRRPPPKKRASVFDAAAAARKPAVTAQAQKMNTLEKSRLDWAGFVDKEGIGEELKKHTRGDKAYLDRQAFLGRVEESRDRAWKEGQKK